MKKRILTLTIVALVLLMGAKLLFSLDLSIPPPTPDVPEISVTTPTPTPTPKPAEPKPVKKVEPAPEFGKLEKIGEYTYAGNTFGCDDRMGTPQEVFEALNNYRQVHGIHTLFWSDKLAEVARMRAQQITANGGQSDSHAGFIAFTSNQENFQKVGFAGLSENIGGTVCNLLGVHIIEWLFARDEPHNQAQLDPVWSAVGVGIDNYTVAVIFGGSPY